MSAPQTRGMLSHSAAISSNDSSPAASGRESSVRAESVGTNASVSPFVPAAQRGSRDKAVVSSSTVAVRGGGVPKKRMAAENSPQSQDDFQELSRSRHGTVKRALMPKIAESEGCSSSDPQKTVTAAASVNSTTTRGAATGTEAAEPSQDAATDMQTQDCEAQAAAPDMEFRVSSRAH